MTPLLPLPARTPHEGTQRALESSSGQESEQEGAGELNLQRLQQTALTGGRKDDGQRKLFYTPPGCYDGAFMGHMVLS